MWAHSLLYIVDHIQGRLGLGKFITRSTLTIKCEWKNETQKDMRQYGDNKTFKMDFVQ